MLKKICLECCARPVNCLTILKRTTRDVNTLFQEVGPHPSRPQTQQETSTTPLSSIGDRMRFLPTGLNTLDFMGGIRLGSVTEIVGRAGAGKTQFALQLLLMAAKYNQGAIYIDTEKKLILGRLKDMATQRWSEDFTTKSFDFQRELPTNHFCYDTSSFSMPDIQGGYNESQIQGSQDDSIAFVFKHPDQVLRNMTVKQPKSTEELLKVLEAVEEEILQRNQEIGFPVRVLIVDSIAAPLKRDFAANAVPQRAAAAFSIAQTLKRYAEQLHLAVIVINQAGLDGTQSGGDGGEWRNDQTNVRAALGTSWHHCVSSRILVEHLVDPHQDGRTPHGDVTKHLRTLSVVKSNWMPFTSLNFEITPVGIFEIRRAEEVESNQNGIAPQTI